MDRIAEHIAAGPVWREKLETVEMAGSPDPRTWMRCAACREPVRAVDETTGLCRPCWRTWRFARTTGEQLCDMSPGLADTIWRRKDREGFTYSFTHHVLTLAGGLLGLLRDWEIDPSG
jgi:hypothetical protein